MKFAILVVMILILSITWIFYLRLKNKQEKLEGMHKGRKEFSSGGESSSK